MANNSDSGNLFSDIASVGKTPATHQGTSYQVHDAPTPNPVTNSAPSPFTGPSNHQTTKSSSASASDSFKKAATGFVSRSLIHQKKSSPWVIVLVIIIVVINALFDLSPWAIKYNEQRASRATAHPATPNISSLTTPNDLGITDFPLLAFTQQHQIYYAFKINDQVSVIKKNLLTGTDETIFEFTDSSGASDNPLTSNVSYSSAKDAFAYATPDGLYTYDVATGTITPIVEKTGQLISGYCPGYAGDDANTNCPQWTASSLESVYSIGSPEWSGDGEYLSFDGHQFEGGLPSVISSDGSSNDSEFIDTWCDVEWATSGHQLASACQNLMAGQNELLISSSTFPEENSYDYLGDTPVIALENLSDYTTEVEPDNVVPVFYGAQPSPDGEKLFFHFITWDDWVSTSGNEEEIHSLAVINRDGSDLEVIAPRQNATAVYFSSDSKKLWYIIEDDGQNRLYSYNLTTKQKTPSVFLSNYYTSWIPIAWSDDGNLLLEGYRFSDNHKPTDQIRMIIDVVNNQIIYEEEPETIVSHLGFAK